MKNIKIENRTAYLDLFRGILNSNELFLLDFAYELAKYAHGYLNQKRDSGERYFNHPREVSVILAAEFGVYNVQTHIMALFHDCAEDTHLLTIERIQHVFGPVIAAGVRSLTKANTSGLGKIEYLVQYFQALVAAGWEPSVVKIADRIHNLRSLDLQNSTKVLKQIQETREYFPQVLKTVEIHSADLAQKMERALWHEVEKLSVGTPVWEYKLSF